MPKWLFQSEFLRKVIANVSKQTKITFLDKINEKKLIKKLINKILRVRSGLVDQGLKKGDKVLSLLENSYEQIILFFSSINSNLQFFSALPILPVFLKKLFPERYDILGLASVCPYMTIKSILFFLHT